MKITAHVLICIFVLGTSLASAQQPPNDPIGENLFPPELLMQNQKAIGLSEEQRNFIKGEMRKTQGQFTDLQWQLQDEMEAMATMLKKDKLDEQRVLSQLDKVLNLEREIKRAQIALIVRIKNRLTPEQQAQLREIKKTMQEEGQHREMEKRMKGER